MYARGYKFVQIAKALGMSYEVAIETTRKALAKTRRQIAIADSWKKSSDRGSRLTGNQTISIRTSVAEAVSEHSEADAETQDSYSFGEVVVNIRSQVVLRQGRIVDLSSKEFGLLRYFLRYKGETLTRDRLLREVWGYDRSSQTRTLDTYIARLRQKLEPETEQPRFFITVRSVGYRFTT